MREIPLIHACRLLSGGPTLILACCSHEKQNAMALTWAMPCSQDPPCIAVSLAPNRFSYKIIRQTGEFVLNIPGRDLLDKTHACGVWSGRNREKLVALAWSTRFGRYVRAPYLNDCLAHIECQIKAHYRVGDRRLFVAEVLLALAEEYAFDKRWTEEADTLHYLGGNEYISQGKLLIADENRSMSSRRERSFSNDLFTRPIEDLDRI